MDDKIEAWLDKALSFCDKADCVGLLGHLRTTPEGYRLVPVEPTPKMSAAGFCVSEADHDPAGVYRAMLAASQESGT